MNYANITRSASTVPYNHWTLEDLMGVMQRFCINSIYMCLFRVDKCHKILLKIMNVVTAIDTAATQL